MAPASTAGGELNVAYNGSLSTMFPDADATFAPHTDHPSVTLQPFVRVPSSVSHFTLQLRRRRVALSVAVNRGNRNDGGLLGIVHYWHCAHGLRRSGGPSVCLSVAARTPRSNSTSVQPANAGNQSIFVY